ncbi:MAG: hypothetical protein JXA50_05670 [Deltaproteobacteria bacterium]|nr:hypothetical protein [Deltaproteobacteria bacterium]
MSNAKIIGVIIMVALFAVFTASGAYAGKKSINPEDFNLSKAKTDVVFDSSVFQSGITSDKSIGTLAKEQSTIGTKATAYGFAAKSEEAKFFLIGTLYAEALAYLRSNDIDLAADRLKAIEKNFIDLNVPSSLYNYISKTRNLLETKRYSVEVVGEFLSLFQPFYEDYAKGKGDDWLTLFRAGTWLVDMSLAAAAGDTNLLRQKAKLDYFTTEMKRMDAPKGALDALAEITKISEQKEIAEKDAKQVLKLVKKIQTVLG